MLEQYPYRIVIPPVPDGVFRPLWSVMIPTYNCANYLRETLSSVLMQDPGVEKMQIAVIDDCSTNDDPEAIVKELGNDRVEFYRQPKNFGYIRNFETCLLQSRGQFIHLLHGDDRVKEGFYQKMQATFVENPEIGAAFCRHVHIDEFGTPLWTTHLERSESGILNNGVERLASEQRIQAPAIAVRREVYEKLGGFDRRFSCCGEDWEMWVRVASQYPIWYEVEPLAFYRIHSKSLSRSSTRTGADIRDLRMAIELMKPYLPESRVREISDRARTHWALYAVRTLASKMLASGDIEGAFNQIKEALKCSRSWQVIKASTRSLIRVLSLQMKQKLDRGMSKFI